MKKSNYLAIVLLLVLSFGLSNANEEEDSMSTTTEVKADVSVEAKPMIRTTIGVKEKMELDRPTMSGSMIKEKMELERSKSGSGIMDDMKEVRTGSGIREDIKVFKNDIKEIRNEKKEVISTNLQDLKDNRSEIKTEFSLKSVLKGLTPELITEVKTLDETFRNDVKALEEKIKTNIGDIVKVKELRLELQNIRIAYNEKLISLVTDTEVKNTLTKRLELLKQNFELIDSNIDARIEYRGALNDKVTTYKDKLSTKLGNGLPKVKEANIEKVLSKVDSVITIIENNTKITQYNKDKIIAQIIALKELLEEQIESNSSVGLDISAE
ncbi:MAG: hypothetical protein PHV23_00690 [Candidatus Gracilibacteria bacterium]|nr:hypothetical protein [Candidatus Gracilibacteria bacterium]